MEITRLHVGKRRSEVAIHNASVYLAGPACLVEMVEMVEIVVTAALR